MFLDIVICFTPELEEEAEGRILFIRLPVCPLPVSITSFTSVLFDSDCPKKQAGHKEKSFAHGSCVRCCFRNFIASSFFKFFFRGWKLEEQFRNEQPHENPRARTFRVSTAWSDVQTLISDSRYKLELTLLLRKTLFCSGWVNYPRQLIVFLWRFYRLHVGFTWETLEYLILHLVGRLWGLLWATRRESWGTGR